MSHNEKVICSYFVAKTDIDLIKLKEFLIFDFIEIPPRTMPDGREIEKQYSLRVRMSDSYKKRIKEYLNGKNKGED